LACCVFTSLLVTVSNGGRSFPVVEVVVVVIVVVVVVVIVVVVVVVVVVLFTDGLIPTKV
jgi:hypothetical protein